MHYVTLRNSSARKRRPINILPGPIVRAKRGSQGLARGRTHALRPWLLEAPRSFFYSSRMEVPIRTRNEVVGIGHLQRSAGDMRADFTSCVANLMAREMLDGGWGFALSAFERIISRESASFFGLYSRDSFDLAYYRREYMRAGIVWEEPLMLFDTSWAGKVIDRKIKVPVSVLYVMK